MLDPEKAFLNSEPFLAAVEGVREALSHRGYTADDDTMQSVAVSVLVRHMGAGGLEEAGVHSLVAMVLSASNKVHGHLDLNAVN